MEEARYNMYTKTKARLRLRNFPPNSTNMLLHVQRVSNCYGTTFDLDSDLGSHK